MHRPPTELCEDALRTQSADKYESKLTVGILHLPECFGVLALFVVCTVLDLTNSGAFDTLQKV